MGVVAVARKSRHGSASITLDNKRYWPRRTCACWCWKCRGNGGIADRRFRVIPCPRSRSLQLSPGAAGADGAGWRHCFTLHGTVSSPFVKGKRRWLRPCQKLHSAPMHRLRPMEHAVGKSPALSLETIIFTRHRSRRAWSSFWPLSPNPLEARRIVMEVVSFLLLW